MLWGKMTWGGWPESESGRAFSRKSFALRYEWSQGASPEGIWGKDILGRVKSTCKGPRVVPAVSCVGKSLSPVQLVRRHGEPQEVSGGGGAEWRKGLFHTSFSLSIRSLLWQSLAWMNRFFSWSVAAPQGSAWTSHSSPWTWPGFQKI